MIDYCIPYQSSRPSALDSLIPNRACAKMHLWQRGQGCPCCLIYPECHVWVRTESASIGDIIQPLKNISIRPKTGHAEWDDDDTTTKAAMGLYKGTDAMFGFDTTIRPIFSQCFTLDIDERTDCTQPLNSSPHVGQPSLILLVISRPMCHNEDRFCRWIKAQRLHTINQNIVDQRRFDHSLLAQEECCVRLDWFRCFHHVTVTHLFHRLDGCVCCHSGWITRPHGTRCKPCVVVCFISEVIAQAKDVFRVIEETIAGDEHPDHSDLFDALILQPFYCCSDSGCLRHAECDFDWVTLSQRGDDLFDGSIPRLITSVCHDENTATSLIKNLLIPSGLAICHGVSYCTMSLDHHIPSGCFDGSTTSSDEEGGDGEKNGIEIESQLHVRILHLRGTMSTTHGCPQHVMPDRTWTYQKTDQPVVKADKGAGG